MGHLLALAANGRTNVEAFWTLLPRRGVLATTRQVVVEAEVLAALRSGDVPPGDKVGHEVAVLPPGLLALAVALAAFSALSATASGGTILELPLEVGDLLLAGFQLLLETPGGIVRMVRDVESRGR